MLHCTCTIQHVTSLRYIFRSFSLPLVVFLLFLPLFSLVVGYNFLFGFFVIVYDFGTVISGVSCTLPNNWAKLFCTLKTGANSNGYSTCVPFNLKKDPLPSPLLSSRLISCYLRSVP